MSRDAATTRTGLILGAASLLLAVTAFVRSPQPRPGCVLVAPPASVMMNEPLEAAVPEVETRTRPEPGHAPWCDRYIVDVDRLSRCSLLPRETAHALLDAVYQAHAAWQNVPAEAMQALSDACRQADEAILQAEASLCPQQQ